MRNIQWAGIACAVVIGVTVAAAQTRGASSRPAVPSLHVDHVVLDTGQVLAGHDVVGTFIFKNRGKRPVRILRAAPS